MQLFEVTVFVLLIVIAAILAAIYRGLEMILAEMGRIRESHESISRIYERQEREHRRLDRDF